MSLTDDSIAIISEIEHDAREDGYDGLDEATAMEWVWEAQREQEERDGDVMHDFGFVPDELFDPVLW